MAFRNAKEIFSKKPWEKDKEEDKVRRRSFSVRLQMPRGVYLLSAPSSPRLPIRPTFSILFLHANILIFCVCVKLCGVLQSGERLFPAEPCICRRRFHLFL